ncbi:MAG: hypothetical protein WD738_04830 [Pirellulales bacterium]
MLVTQQLAFSSGDHLSCQQRSTGAIAPDRCILPMAAGAGMPTETGDIIELFASAFHG